MRPHFAGIGTASDPILGVAVMRRIATLAGEVTAKHLAPAAKYNIGRAFFQVDSLWRLIIIR